MTHDPNYQQTINEMNTKISIQIRTFCYKTDYTTHYTLSTEITTMTKHTVHLLLQKINLNENTLPVLRVDNQVFVLDKAGLHNIPDVRAFFFYNSSIAYFLFLFNYPEKVSTY